MLAPFAPQDFAQLRQVVDPRLAGLPGEQLRSTIDDAFGDGTADSIDQDLEGVFDGFTRAVSHALPAITTIGGGVLQGAMAGSAAGLPGIIAGAAAGGAGAGLSRYGSGAARQVGNALTGVTNLAGQFTPMGQAGAALGSTVSGLGAMAGGRAAGRPGMPGGGGGALGQLGGLLSSPQIAGALGGLFGGTGPAGQLASAMQRPEVHQAMAALRLGNMGSPTLPVGPQQQPVPTAVFAQLLAHLAQQVQSAPAANVARQMPSAIGEAESLEFMSDGEGGFVGDPSSPGDRAARLWDMLNDSLADQFVEALGQYGSSDTDDADSFDGYDSDYAAESAWQDQLDLAEAEDIHYALSTEPRYGW